MECMDTACKKQGTADSYYMAIRLGIFTGCDCNLFEDAAAYPTGFPGAYLTGRMSVEEWIGVVKGVNDLIKRIYSSQMAGARDMCLGFGCTKIPLGAYFLAIGSTTDAATGATEHGGLWIAGMVLLWLGVALVGAAVALNMVLKARNIRADAELRPYLEEASRLWHPRGVSFSLLQSGMTRYLRIQVFPASESAPGPAGYVAPQTAGGAGAYVAVGMPTGAAMGVPAGGPSSYPPPAGPAAPMAPAPSAGVPVPADDGTGPAATKE